MDKKAKQLGVSSFSVARNRLVKMILFDVITKTGLSSCFKCGAVITDIDELTIEHKKPWWGVDTKLFWDLDNIAFSHLRCNKPDRNGSIKLRKIGPDGTAWCYRCKLFEPIEKFHKNPTRWNGLMGHCKKNRPPRYKKKLESMAMVRGSVL